MEYVAVSSVKSSGECHNQKGKSTNILKPRIDIYLKPSLNDGRLLTLSFDMLLDMFSGFSISVNICHSVTKVSLNVAGVTLKTMALCPWFLEK